MSSSSSSSPSHDYPFLSQPVASVYLFTAAFFFCGLFFHFSRAIFTLNRTSIDRGKLLSDRSGSQMDTYFLTCFHIHYCATAQYFIYYLGTTGAAQILGFPSPFRDIPRVVPILRYLCWFNTLPSMAGIPCSLANASNKEITPTMLSGMLCIIFGWGAVGFTFEYKWAALVIFFTLSELCLIDCCRRLNALMSRTSQELSSKVKLTKGAIEIPNTSSLTGISKGISITWHFFPAVLLFTEYSDIFTSVDPKLVEALAFASIDIVAKSFCTMAIMLSSFILGEYMTSMIDAERQMEYEMKTKMEEAFVAFVFHEMRNPFVSVTPRLLYCFTTSTRRD